MKKSILAFSVLCSLSAFCLTACDKVKDKLFPTFETEIGDVAVTIPIMLAGAEWSNNGSVTFNLDSAIRAYTANTFSINNLSSIKVKDATIILTDANDLNNLSNFETASLAVSSGSNTTPAVVASVSIPNQPATSINMAAANSPELKSYLKGSQFTCTITGKTRRSTTMPLHASVSVTLAIK